MRDAAPGRSPSGSGGLPTGDGQGPVHLDPAPGGHPVRSCAPCDDLGSEPAGKPLDAPVPAGGAAEDGLEPEFPEAEPQEGARHLHGEAVAAPIVGGELDSEKGLPLVRALPPQARASAQAPGGPLEDAELVIPAGLSQFNKCAYRKLPSRLLELIGSEFGREALLEHIQQRLFAGPKNGLPATALSCANVLRCVVDQKDIRWQQPDRQCRALEESHVGFLRADLSRVLDAVDSIDQAERAHEVLRPTVLLIGGEVNLKAPRPKLLKILEQPAVEVRVLLKPVINEPICRDVGSNPFQHLWQPILQPSPTNNNIVPMVCEELSVQVFRPEAQVGLEGCRPVAAILGPPPDEDSININHEGFDHQASCGSGMTSKLKERPTFHKHSIKGLPAKFSLDFRWKPFVEQG